MTDQPITWTRTLTDRNWRFDGLATLEDGTKVHIIAGYHSNKKTRLYVDGESSAAASRAEAERLSKEAGTWERGKSLEADKAWDRHNREVIKNKRETIEFLVDENELLRSLLAGHKLSFGRKAGCSCGCSPAFVVDTVIRVRDTVPGWRAGEFYETTLYVTDLFVAVPRPEEVKA